MGSVERGDSALETARRSRCREEEGELVKAPKIRKGPVGALLLLAEGWRHVIA